MNHVLPKDLDWEVDLGTESRFVNPWQKVGDEFFDGLL